MLGLEKKILKIIVLNIISTNEVPIHQEKQYFNHINDAKTHTKRKSPTQTACNNKLYIKKI